MTRAGAAIGAALLIALQGSAYAQAGTFAAPPRTIADITAILDQEKPDLERIAKLRADADAMPPPNADAATLVDSTTTERLPDKISAGFAIRSPI